MNRVLERIAHAVRHPYSLLPRAPDGVIQRARRRVQECPALLMCLRGSIFC